MDSGFSSNAWTRSKAMSWWSRTSANDGSPERLDRARRYHLESKRGDETRSFLLDFGPTAQSELANLDLFKIEDRKSTRLNSSHRCISYAVFCLKKKTKKKRKHTYTRELSITK